MTMDAILSSISSVVTAAIGWIGDFAAVITDNPILLIFVIVSFVGLGVGLVRRLMSL